MAGVFAINYETVRMYSHSVVKQPSHYVEDYGKSVVTAGATGKLTVLNGAEKIELPLEPAGDNTMAAKGGAKLVKGAKAIAAMTFVDKRAANVRFSIK